MQNVAGNRPSWHDDKRIYSYTYCYHILLWLSNLQRRAFFTIKVEAWEERTRSFALKPLSGLKKRQVKWNERKNWKCERWTVNTRAQNGKRNKIVPLPLFYNSCQQSASIYIAFFLLLFPFRSLFKFHATYEMVVGCAVPRLASTDILLK